MVYSNKVNTFKTWLIFQTLMLLSSDIQLHDIPGLNGKMPLKPSIRQYWTMILDQFVESSDVYIGKL